MVIEVLYNTAIECNVTDYNESSMCESIFTVESMALLGEHPVCSIVNRTLIISLGNNNLIQSNTTLEYIDSTVIIPYGSSSLKRPSIYITLPTIPS